MTKRQQKKAFAEDLEAVRARLEALNADKHTRHAEDRAVIDKKLRRLAKKKAAEAAARRKAAAAYRKAEEERKRATRREAELLRRKLHMRRAHDDELESTGSMLTSDNLTSEPLSSDSDSSVPSSVPPEQNSEDESEEVDAMEALSILTSPTLVRKGSTFAVDKEHEDEVRAALHELNTIKRGVIMKAVLRLQGYFRGVRERRELAEKGMLPENGVFAASPLVTDSGLEIPRVLIARAQPYAAAHLQFEVNGCDLVTLVELLTHPGATLPDLARIILLTHTNFVSSHTLLTLVTLRFETMPTLNVPEFVRSTLPRIQAKVFELIHLWLTEFFPTFADPDAPATLLLLEFLARVRSLHTCYCSSTMRRVAKHLKHTYSHAAKAYKARVGQPSRLQLSASDAMSAPQSQLISLSAASSSTITFSPGSVHALEVARQITLLDSAPFRAIQYVELLKQAWTKDNARERAPNVMACIDRFNFVVSWSATEVLKYTSTEARAHSICLLLDVASNLAVLQNYSSLMAILSALQSAELDRLKYTWERIPEEYNETFSDLKQIMNMSLNYRQYRDTLRKIKPPAVPYLGVLLQDLTFIDDGNEKRLPQPSEEEGIEALANDPEFRALLFPDKNSASSSSSGDDDDDDEDAVAKCVRAEKGKADAEQQNSGSGGDGGDGGEGPSSSAAAASTPSRPTPPLKVLYNIDKQRMNYRAITEILAFQEGRYILHPVDSIINYLETAESKDADERYQLSLTREPRDMKEPSKKERKAIEHHPQEGSLRPELEIIDAHFMDDLTAVMSTQRFEPGVPIVTAGMVGSEMYFIKDGMVTVELSNGHMFDLNRGSFFGEVALFLEQVRSATVRAKTITTVLTLAKNDLDGVLTKYPDMYAQFKRLAQARLESDKHGPGDVPKWLKKVQSSM